MTLVQKEIKTVYLGTTQVRPSGWKPGANTLVYLTLNDSLLDTSGNNRNATQQSGGTTTRPYIIGSSGEKCYRIYGYDDQSADAYCISGTYADTELGSNPRTISCWVKFDEGYTTHELTPICLGTAGGGSSGGWFGLWALFGNKSAGIIRYYSDPSGANNSFVWDDDWHHFVMTYDDTNKGKMYIDGASYTLTNNSTATFNTRGTRYLIGARRTNHNVGANFSRFILENKVWSADDVADYYDSTKAIYGK